MRAQSDAILEASGVRPKVYLVALGPEPSHRRRVGFIRDWLEAGGIEPVYDGEAATPDEAIRSLRATGASLACLCGDDAAYAARGAAFAAAIKAAGVKGLILAGRPRDIEAELRGAGVDAFVFAGGDAVAALQDLYRRLARFRRGTAVMSGIPDFSKLHFEAATEAPSGRRSERLDDA